MHSVVQKVLQKAICWHKHAFESGEFIHQMLWYNWAKGQTWHMFLLNGWHWPKMHLQTSMQEAKPVKSFANSRMKKSIKKWESLLATIAQNMVPATPKKLSINNRCCQLFTDVLVGQLWPIMSTGWFDSWHLRSCRSLRRQPVVTLLICRYGYRHQPLGDRGQRIQTQQLLKGHIHNII